MIQTTKSKELEKLLRDEDLEGLVFVDHFSSTIGIQFYEGTTPIEFFTIGDSELFDLQDVQSYVLHTYKKRIEIKTQ